MTDIDRVLALPPYAEPLPDWPIVLYGAGQLGREVLRRLRHAGVRPWCFVDNNKNLTVVDGLHVNHFDEGAFGHSIQGKGLWVPTVYNAAAIREELDRRNVRRHVPLPALLNHHGLLPLACLDYPSRVRSHAAEIRAATDIWADEESRAEYLEQIKYRLTFAPPATPKRDVSEMYWEGYRKLSDPIIRDAGEVFVDAGAFDGDTVQAFMARWPGFREIHAFEPDRQNFDKLMQFASMSYASRKLWMHNVALSNHDGSISFLASGTPGSRVGETKETVPARKLDSVCEACDIKPTLVKLDVENHEIPVLQGARETIRRCRPVVVAVLYHQPTDLWRIPLLLRELMPDGKLFLRRYADDCWELLALLVPPERME